jgi:hypothetical protein
MLNRPDLNSELEQILTLPKPYRTETERPKERMSEREKEKELLGERERARERERECVCNMHGGCIIHTQHTLS